MTPTEFKSWRKRLGLTQAQAGQALGYTPRWIIAFEQGINHRRKPCVIPLSVELACKWLEQQWRPIETAPKAHNEDILVARFGDGDDDDYFSAIGQWWVQDWAFMYASEKQTNNPILFCFEPTHWQPLPQPPEE